MAGSGLAAGLTTFARVALIGFVLTTSSGCLVSIGGCGDDEAAAFDEIEHYAGTDLQPKDDGLGSCGAAFTTRDDPSAVIEHYRSRLEAAGWAIDPPEPSPPPGLTDGIEGQSISLGARKGTMVFSVSAELLGQPQTNFVVHVGDSG